MIREKIFLSVFIFTHLMVNPIQLERLAGRGQSDRMQMLESRPHG
jgi:hypothetical protein